MLLSEILRGIVHFEKNIPQLDIKRITKDSALIEKNTLFVFLKGLKFDTKKIIYDVIEKSPSAIISDTELSEVRDIPVLHVKNARKAYAYALWNFNSINEDRLKFYAVTGTNGKTTTATMLFNIFKASKIRCGFIGTGKIIIDDGIISDPYYSMTTPDPELLYPVIKKMELSGCERIVMEVSSHSLALHKVSPIKFECSIFTNLSEEHMDFHNSIREYYSAKLSLFKQSKSGIFNLDDIYSKKAMLDLSADMDTHGVSINKDADAIAKDLTLNGIEGSTYIYREKDKIFKVELPYPGRYNVSNSLLAIKCALLSGIDYKAIKESFGKEKQIDGRFEILSQNPKVIIDYAHTYTAFKEVLGLVNGEKSETQRIITVFGCGGERDKTKRPIMARISEELSDFSIVTSDNSRNESPDQIILDIITGFTQKSSFTVIKNREEAIMSAIKKAQESDIILIIGQGHERYNIDDGGYHDFDEREIVAEALKERKSY